MRRVVLAAAAGVVALGVAWGVSSVSKHESLRERWQGMRDVLGTDAYDAAASDRLYVSSRMARRSAGGAALLTVGGAWVLLSARRRRTAGTGPLSADGVSRRLWTSSLIDLSIAAALVASTFIDDGESVLLYMYTRVAPLLALMSLAVPLQTSGQSLGLRAVGLAVDPHPGRGLIAAAALAALPLGLLVGLFRPSWTAIHLRIAGLDPRVASSRAAE